MPEHNDSPKDSRSSKNVFVMPLLGVDELGAEVERLWTRPVYSPDSTTPPFKRVSPQFLKATFRDCPFCSDGGDHLLDWVSPNGVKERTIHLNQNQTALINTAAATLAGIMGKPEYVENLPAAVAEIVRLFLLTDPAWTYILQDKPGAVGRGKVKSANWVDVRPVERNAAPMGEVITPEASEENPLHSEAPDGDDAYAEPGDNPDDLYKENDDPPHGEDDEKGTDIYPGG